MLWQLLFRAMHRSMLPFSNFDTDERELFFRKLRRLFKLPSPYQIGGELLHGEYLVVMGAVVDDIGGWPTVGLTLDGMTNTLGKQVLNMMACGPVALFMDHFGMNLSQESTANLLQTLLGLKKRLRISLYTE